MDRGSERRVWERESSFIHWRTNHEVNIQPRGGAGVKTGIIAWRDVHQPISDISLHRLFLSGDGSVMICQ
jgi:hypothetical protein